MQQELYDVEIYGVKGKQTVTFAPETTVGDIQKELGLEKLCGEDEKPLDAETQLGQLGKKGKVVLYELVGVVGGYDL